MRQFIKNFATLSGCGALVFTIWLLLATLANFSLVLGWIVGIVLTFTVPGLVFFVVAFFNTSESSVNVEPIVFASVILSTVLMIGSMLTVPFFMDHNTCDSTFESAFDDTKNCDYMCFNKLTPLKEKAISFKYSYKMYNEPHQGTSHYIPVQTPPNIFIWARGKPTDDLQGNCLKHGAIDHDYEHLNKLSQNKAIPGKLVLNPNEDLHEERSTIKIAVLVMGLLVALALAFYSRRQKK